jgi:Holliday junction resolvase RusA-like endonuclease
VSDWLFKLFVAGIPTTKGSPMAFLMNRKQIAANPKARAQVNMIEGRRGDSKQRHLAWTKAVFENAEKRVQETGHVALDGPLIWCGRFYVPRPKSRKHDVYCDTRPDYDKLMRCVWDELQRAKVITQDARFVKIGEPNGKYYECEDYPPGVWIGIRSAEFVIDDDDE